MNGLDFEATAQKVIDTWEENEGQAMRAGHAFTMKQLIVEALKAALAEQVGSEWRIINNTLKEFLNDSNNRPLTTADVIKLHTMLRAKGGLDA